MEKSIQQKQKAGIMNEWYDPHKGDIRKIHHSGPDEVVYGIYEWFSSQLNTLVYISLNITH